MTISNPNSSVLVQGNGVSTSFTYNFLIPDATDAVISLIDAATSASVTLSQAQFTLTGAGNPLGGTFVYPITGSAITSGFFLSLERVLPLVQNMSIRNQGTFYPAAVEGALDYLTMVTQQLQAQIDALETDGAISPNADAITYTPQYFGAIGNGVANDSVAITAAKASAFPIFVPVGNYDASDLSKVGGLPKRMWGDGIVEAQFSGSASFAARFYSYISSRPTTASQDSILYAFNGDWSGSPFPVEAWIVGANTLGVPTTGYLSTPETSPHYTYLFNSSGHNQSTTGNDGRTGASAIAVKVYQAGMGDAGCYNGVVAITATKPGISGPLGILAGSAGVILNGSVQAFTASCYCNLVEVNAIDNGHDVAAAGFVTNLDRTVTTGAFGAFWFGYRAQSVGGNAANNYVDALFSGDGPTKFGLDLTGAVCSLGAIALGPNQKILGNAVSGTFFASSAGTEWIDYDATTGWRLVANSIPQIQVNPTGIGFFNTPPIAKGTVTGSITAGTALTNLLVLMQNYGILTKNTTA